MSGPGHNALTLETFLGLVGGGDFVDVVHAPAGLDILSPKDASATLLLKVHVLGYRADVQVAHKAALTWRPSRYRPADIELDMRAEPGVVLADVLQRTGGVYETTTRLTPKFREDIHEIAELTSDDELLRIAELPRPGVSV